MQLMINVNKIRMVFLLFILLPVFTSAQQDSIIKRIVLIGDGGELTGGIHPISRAVRNSGILDDKTTVLFLGDNLYKKGLPVKEDPRFNELKAALDSQLVIAGSSGANVYLIPGNHDWESGKKGGYDAILRQQKYVDDAGLHNVKFYPENGCPGPEAIDLGHNVMLMIIDSQWWLHRHKKPGTESGCNSKTKDEFIERIKEITNQNPDKLFIVASHHPVRSHGPHGGYFTFKQHIFPLTDLKKYLYIPLPVIGSIYPLVRTRSCIRQDLKHPVYAAMIRELTGAMQANKNTVFVSGHEHNLQLIQDAGFYQVVSGSGAKTNRVKKAGNSRYAAAEPGFCVLEISVNKSVRVTFFTVHGEVKKTYSEVILNYAAGSEPVSKMFPEIMEGVNMK
jgi:DNA repair exonuclease SbcCD nuclease subunit